MHFLAISHCTSTSTVVSTMDRSSHLKPCQLCTFISTSLKDLLKHIRLVHSHRAGFRITCCLSGCQRMFRTFGVFRNHVYAYHTDQEAIVLERDEDGEDGSGGSGGEDGSSGAGGSGGAGGYSGLGTLDSSTSTSDMDCRKRAAMMWILKVQEKFLLPQSTMDMITKDITVFIQDLLLDLGEDVCASLTASGCDPGSVSGLFHSSSAYANPFVGVESQHMQMKICREVLGIVVSI